MRAQFLHRAVIILMCVCACLHSMPVLGNECCCCEDEKFGFWPSRGAGGRAFIIGATITAAGIAAILVACNNRSRHSSSSCKSRAANNDNNDNNDEFNPNLNPNGGGTPAAFVNNFANQAMNNANAIAEVGVPIEIETSTFTPINTITTQGGATQIPRSKKYKSINKYKTGNHSQKLSSADSEEQASVDFKVKLSGSHTGSISLIPFVVLSDGKTLEGTPFIAKANDYSNNPAPIAFRRSSGGNHKVGVRVASANVSTPVIIHLECAISNSNNSSVQVVGTMGSHLEKQIVSEFTL